MVNKFVFIFFVFVSCFDLLFICCWGLGVLIIKRVLAIGEPIVITKKRYMGLLNRVIFDRDISDRQKWINRD